MLSKQAQARIAGIFVIALLIGGILGAVFGAPNFAHTYTVKETVLKTVVKTTRATVTTSIPNTITVSKTHTVSAIIPTTFTTTQRISQTLTVTSTMNRTITETVNQTVTIAQTTTTVTTTTTKTVEKVRKQVLQVCFSKEQDCARIITNWILRANESIHIMVYSFTSQPIASALIVANTQKPDLDIKVVIERNQANVTGSVYQMLLDANITVALDDNPYLMHHKVAIIDDKIIITGSYNYSQSAEDRNDENLIVIADQEIAELYEQEFQRIWDQATA